ncbi:hypothetical protein M3Y97_01000400 [Aphelenchoides bicaudatus]|nr:hypothetical protein M3Y97_01000400 [Aphelenchoides bicaudatus]
MSFKGKSVIVTGSSSGIGQEAALIFGEQGASVTIHGQNAERLKKTEDLLKKAGVTDARILTVLGPIEQEETRKKLIDETVKKFGKLDVLVNNAGISHPPGNDPNSLESLDYVMNTNLRSVIALTRLAAPHLEKTKGNVVNVSSVGSQRVATHAVPYVLTKAALDHFTRNAAVQYASQGIRINTVSPGATDTNFATRHNSNEEALKAFYQYFVDNVIPMHRFGSSREVANVIEFLASDKASYVTGSNYVVDGGVLAGPPSDPKRSELGKLLTSPK